MSVIELKDLSCNYKYYVYDTDDVEKSEGENVIIEEFSGSVDGSSEDLLDLNILCNQGQSVGIFVPSDVQRDMLASVLSLKHFHSKFVLEGDLLFNEKSIRDMGKDELVKVRRLYQMIHEVRDVQSVFPKLFPLRLIFQEVVDTHLYDLREDEKNRLIIDSLNIFQIEHDVLNKYNYEFNKFDFVRISLALSFVTRPDVLVLNNVLAGLESTEKIYLIELLNSTPEHNTPAIIYLSQNIINIYQLCTYIYIIKNGKIAERGEINDVFDNPKKQFTKDIFKSIPNFLKK